MLSGKVSEDIFRKQLERLVGAAVSYLQQGIHRLLVCADLSLQPAVSN